MPHRIPSILRNMQKKARIRLPCVSPPRSRTLFIKAPLRGSKQHRYFYKNRNKKTDKSSICPFFYREKSVLLRSLDLSHQFKARSVSVTLKFILKESIHDIHSKTRADHACAHAKHVGIVVAAGHLCGIGI